MAIYWPLSGDVISVMGDPRDGGARSHQGIDIGGPRFAPIVAPVTGTIVYAQNVGGLGGYAVKIKDASGNMHYMAHMDPSSTSLWQSYGLTPGTTVTAGSLVGYVGNTGNAAGGPYHVHYSINEGTSNVIDPLDFLANAMYPDGSASGGAAGAPSNPATADDVPKGYQVYRVDGKYYVVYTWNGGRGATGTVFYAVQGQPPNGSVKTLTSAEWKKKIANGWVNAGSTEAFEGIDTSRTFQSLIEEMLYEVGMYGTKAMEDEGVLHVISLWFARPDMSEAEFANRLRRTEWWRTHTDAERAWNDKSPAQRQQEIMEAAAQINGLFFTYVGRNIDARNWRTFEGLKESNPKILRWARLLASGQMSEQQIINTFLKPIAEKDENSPWSRTLREEEQAQGQFAVDVENKAQQIMDIYARQGVKINRRAALRLAEDVMMNSKSDADVYQMVQTQAQGLYATKPENLDTYTWAQPFIGAYEELMETPEPDLFQRDIQKALTEGMTLGDFRKHLRGTQKWMHTKNAQDEMIGTVAQLGNLFGMV